jgi:predicted dehydrogenase
MEAMWMRLNPLIRAAAELARSGRIGAVTGVRADLSRYFDYDPAHRLFDLAAGGGALLDLGVYPATFAWLVLGRPSVIQATGSRAETGSDLTVGLQWGYPDGRVAQIYCSAAGPSPLAALITGTEGWISVEPRIHRPERLVIFSGNAQEVVEGEIEPGNGYRRQAAEVAARLRAGESESPLVPLDDTIALLEVIDEARRQLGARYPADA